MWWETRSLGDAAVRAIRGMIIDLERLRLRLPEAIMEGEAEEYLLDAYRILREYKPPQLVRRPYSGLDQEAKLLAQLALALRARMERAGTPYIAGVDYFIERLDSLLAKARAMIGLHPLLPVGGGDDPRAWRGQ